MNVTIYPTRFILEKAFLGSKSLTHRFLIASYLINEGIILENVCENDDINATISFLKEVNKEKEVNKDENNDNKKESKNLQKNYTFTLKDNKNNNIQIESSS